MGKILVFNNNDSESSKRPLFCAQDFRDYVGYRVLNVLSDECDSNTKLILINEKTRDKVCIDIDRALDGETIFVVDESGNGGGVV